jgi:transposase-like protein
MARRFTEAEKLAALADLRNGMTLEQTSKKHKCSTASLMQWKKAMSGGAQLGARRTVAKSGGTGVTTSVQGDRLMELEDENKHLRDENQSLRSLMLDRYIAKEPHPKLQRIAQTLRDSGRNQVQRIMEIILAADAEEPAHQGLETHESTVDNVETNGLPRHPSGTIKLRRKSEQEA